MEKKLNEFVPGEKGVVRRIEGEGKPGTAMQVIHLSAFHSHRCDYRLMKHLLPY